MAFVLFRLLATSVSCIPAFYNSKSPLFPLQNNTVVENIKKYLLLGHQIRRIQTIIIIQILCEPCRESGLWERMRLGPSSFWSIPTSWKRLLSGAITYLSICFWFHPKEVILFRGSCFVTCLSYSIAWYYCLSREVDMLARLPHGHKPTQF